MGINLGKGAPGRRYSKCKNPEADMCFVYSRNSEKASMTGAREAATGDEVKEVAGFL